MRIKHFLLVTLLTVSTLVSLANDYYIATTVLNVRSGEGTGYPVAFTLQKGDEVEVLSLNNGWYRIKYFEKIGYVYSKFLKYSRTVSDLKSETSEKKVSNLFTVIFVGLVLLIVFVLLKEVRDNKLLHTVTGLHRGTKTERDLVLKLLKFGMPANVIFHDLYVKKQKNHFSQIDLVAVTKVGIIVFEVKDYSGWLFGSGSQSQWTQVLAYGKQKYRFYNPILQNQKHVTELRKGLIQYGYIPFYSIVVFYGNCVLKDINYVPNGTFLVKSERVLDVVQFILEENEPVHYTNGEEILRALREAVTNGGIIENQIRHVENIKDMLGKHRIFE